MDRTKALGSKFDIRRGPLVGFKYKKVDFTTYWLSPGSKEATFVFAVALNFERWPDYDVPGDSVSL